MPAQHANVRVLVAGIGGASLGTEIIKCLAAANRYTVLGCDISRMAFGLYEPALDAGFVVPRANYARSVLELCERCGARVVIPGGEEPLVLLNDARAVFEQAGIHIAGNSPDLIARFSDKAETFRLLQALGVAVPQTLLARSSDDLDAFPYPCVVKPARGSGGSSLVFLAATRAEAGHYVSYLTANGRQVLVQEYVSEDEGEFTIGVLHLSDGRLAGSIALRRNLQPRLSHVYKGNNGVISSGYSQGLIDDFPEIRKTAERIASAVGSRGPLNIQGRVRNGLLLPFEINARFSASTYLRALAGFNEIDIFLQHLLFAHEPAVRTIRAGHYLRSLSERYVSAAAMKS